MNSNSCTPLKAFVSERGLAGGRVMWWHVSRVRFIIGVSDDSVYASSHLTSALEFVVWPPWLQIAAASAAVAHN